MLLLNSYLTFLPPPEVSITSINFIVVDRLFGCQQISLTSFPGRVVLDTRYAQNLDLPGYSEGIQLFIEPDTLFIDKKGGHHEDDR